MSTSQTIAREIGAIAAVERSVRSFWAGSRWIQGRLRHRAEADLVEPTLILAAQHRNQLESFEMQARSIERLLAQ